MADPGALARKEIQKNFPKFGTIRKLVSYQVLGIPDYNTGTGVVAPTPIGSPFNVQVIILAVSAYAAAQKDDDPVLDRDKAMLVPALDMPITPNIGDEITGAGDIWRIKGVQADPADATWKMWVRPKAVEVSI